MYEQIYALAGPIQTYRVNGDPSILKDAELTIDLFERFFKDKTVKVIIHTLIRYCWVLIVLLWDQTEWERTGIL